MNIILITERNEKQQNTLMKMVNAALRSEWGGSFEDETQNVHTKKNIYNKNGNMLLCDKFEKGIFTVM